MLRPVIPFSFQKLMHLVTGWCVWVTVAHAQTTWRSSLYPTTWQAPASTVSFATAKMIQDFSYAGYRRGEELIPNVTGPLFNVTEYGADPTGSIDSTVAIQNAINAAAAAGGGVVYLAAGKFRISPQGSNNHCLRISSSHIVLRGAGTSQTYLLNTSQTMNGKSVIQVSPVSTSTGIAQSITTDLPGPTRRIPVANASAFSPGTMVRIRWQFTSDWVVENNQQTWWGVSQPANATYLREVTATDPAAGWIEVDVPTRYWIKTRDNPTVLSISGLLRHVAIESLSIGNSQITKSGWGEQDYTDSTKGAFDAHASWLIRYQNVRDSWISNVHSFQDIGNSSTCHLLSNGILLSQCTRVTMQSCQMRRPQYGGGGGNGYMYRLQNSNECLIKQCVADFSRHGFVISHAGTSGNVFHRCEDRETARATGASATGYTTSGSGSDNHMHFSHSNLWDQCHAFNSFFTAHHRLTNGSTPSHGVTSAHGVFWNTSGSGTRYDDSSSPIVRSEQLNFGYIIGTKATSGTAYFASNPTGGSTSPADHIEGVNTGATLQPQSLFLDQVTRRLSPTITFSSRGGSPTVPASITGNFGQAYGTLPTTARAGFVFTGWFTSATGGTLVTATSTITISADHTLHAQWNAIPSVDAGANQSISMNQWQLWSPTSMSTAAWFDAADAATVSATNHLVSLWHDKSGNQNHASQATASRRPSTGSIQIGGLNAIAFNPFQEQFLSASHTPSLLLDASGGANLFSVFHTSGYVSRGSGLNSIASKGSLLTAGAAYGIRLNDNNKLPFKPSSDILTDPAEVFTSQNLIFCGMRHDVEKTASTFINGRQQSIAALPTISSNNTSALILGGESNTARCADLRLGEFLVVPGVLTAHQRQKFEGYLAHKWSLTASLPANHFYRSSPPQMPTATVALTGLVSDADSTSLTFLWSVISAPAPVSFSHPSSRTSNATFARAGSYLLRLSASDGVTTSTDDVMITVLENNQSDPFVEWALEPKETFFQDFNADAMPNGLAWLLGAESPASDAHTLMPHHAKENTALAMTFRYLTPVRRGSYALQLEYSPSLAPGTWTKVLIPDQSAVVDGASFLISPLPDGQSNHVKVIIPAGPTGKVFARLASLVPGT